jgi:sirohydrochlorin cobaltochelatase
MKLSIILPEIYQYPCENVQPVSMGSAGLKFKGDGTVAWDEIWASFCDLAMAGGPPHKGTLLEAGSQAKIHLNPGRHQLVVDEICRGIALVAGMNACRSHVDGWVRVDCFSAGMAGWLARAITMENVSARCEGAVLHLPAGPDYRLEKEIKNVITVLAKTRHYWVDHMGWSRQQAIARLFVEMESETPLVQPALADCEFQMNKHQALFSKMSESISQATGFEVSSHRYDGWIGVDCRSISAAIWMMRAMVVNNVLSRREDTVLFVPVNPNSDSEGDVVVTILARMHSLAVAQGIV